MKLKALHRATTQITPTANASEIVVIPSCTVRVLTDREYSAYLAQAADRQARRIGARLRELRKARGISGKELAELAGIHPQSLSRIEHGQHDVVFTTLRRLLAAMSCAVEDLAVPETADEAETTPALARR